MHCPGEHGYGPHWTPAGPPVATRTKFVTRKETVESVPTRVPSRGKKIDRPGVPPAGPSVTITATDAVTPGFKADPLSVTSCSRIVCGPEGSARTIVLTLAFAVHPPSTKMSTWPESGEDVPFPGSVRLKFVTSKTTTTGLPLPITVFRLGKTIDRVGAGAARTLGEAIPETTSAPTVARSKATIRAFTLRTPPAIVRGPGHDLPAAQDQDDQDEGQEKRDSAVGDERQAHGGRRDHVDWHVSSRIGGQGSVVVVHETRRDGDVSFRQRYEEDRLILNHLHHDDALDEKLHVTLARCVRLASRLHQREILDPVRYVDSMTRRFEPRRGKDRDTGDSPSRAQGRHDADGRADVRVQRGAVVRDELDLDRMGSGDQGE